MMLFMLVQWESTLEAKLHQAVLNVLHTVNDGWPELEAALQHAGRMELALSIRSALEVWAAVAHAVVDDVLDNPRRPCIAA